MCNAATKLIATAALATMITACSGNSGKIDPATELYNQAEAQYQAGNPQQVYLLLDSIKSAYPDSVGLQRRGLMLRRQAFLIELADEIVLVDDSINQCIADVNALKPLIKTINDPRLVEPYSVAAAGYNPDFLSTTGIQARIDDAGQFYIISSLQSALKHTGIKLTASSESAEAGPVPFDGELNYRLNGSEVITFSPMQSQAIGEFASSHRDQGATLQFTGGKSHSVKLNAKQVNAIADCYDYSKAMTRGRLLSLRREKLTRQQQLTTSQIDQLKGAN